MTFKFTSGPAYLLYVACLMGLAIYLKPGFEVAAGYLFGGVVWYTGRRAYKEVKLANMTLVGDDGKG